MGQERGLDPPHDGFVCVIIGISTMMYVIYESWMDIHDAGGRVFSVLPWVWIAYLAFFFSIIAVLTGWLEGRKLGRRFHDVEILGRHPLMRRKTLIGRGSKLLNGLFLSLTFVISIVLFASSMALDLFSEITSEAILGLSVTGVLALIAAPLMIGGWYLVYRYRLAREHSDEVVTIFGKQMMRVLDAAERGERRTTDAIISTLDSAQSVLRFVKGKIKNR